MTARAVVPATWNFANESLKARQTDLLTNKWVKVLRELSPDSGCYLNEADVNEPDLAHAFWGGNYERLVGIKRRVDPEGVFWCKPCVGGGEWAVEGGGLCWR